MPSTIAHPSPLKLSICITTFNRATVIGATLDSILVQLTDDCEIVVLDGASTDDTERVVSEHARRFDRLRYIRQDRNNGLDCDYDRAVELARGEYSWLMPDDDLLKPGAVATVLRALHGDLSLIVVNTEIRNYDMSRILQPRLLDVESDRVYGPAEMDRLYAEGGKCLWYIGGIIIRRAIWLARERKRYYGSSFTYLAVIFQEQLPGETLVIAEPFISYRMGNSHTYSPRHFEIMMVSLPSLLWSLPISESAKRKVCDPEPWRSFRQLLVWRGLGRYSLTEYQKLISPRVHSLRKRLIPAFAAVLPGVLINTFLVVYCMVTIRPFRDGWPKGILLPNLIKSRFHFRKWCVFKRVSQCIDETVARS